MASSVSCKEIAHLKSGPVSDRIRKFKVTRNVHIADPPSNAISIALIKQQEQEHQQVAFDKMQKKLYWYSAGAADAASKTRPKTGKKNFHLSDVTKSAVVLFAIGWLAKYSTCWYS